MAQISVDKHLRGSTPAQWAPALDAEGKRVLQEGLLGRPSVDGAEGVGFIRGRQDSCPDCQ